MLERVPVVKRRAATGAREPVQSLAQVAGGSIDMATLVASPQTQRTYRRACRRFLAWLGPQAGPQDLTAGNVSRYHAQLAAAGLSSERLDEFDKGVAAERGVVGE